MIFEDLKVYHRKHLFQIVGSYFRSHERSIFRATQWINDFTEETSKLVANSDRSTASELKSSESPGGGSTGGNDVRGEAHQADQPTLWQFCGDSEW